MIMPDYLREEEKRLFDEYESSGETCGIYEYAEKHQSDELKAFREAYKKEKEEARARGVIIN